MMQLWTNDHIRFMVDAAEFGTFHRQLAQQILPFLPQGGQICDAGCGLGHLAIELSPYFSSVTACDRANAPLRYLRQHSPENLTILQGDIAANPPDVPYDAMIFCFFGDPQQILSVAQRQCGGEVVVIQRAAHYHRFAAQDASPHYRYDRELAKLLQEKNIPYQTQQLSLEFGQPFRNHADVFRFFRLYDQGKPLTENEILSRLCPIDDHPEFSWYLPQNRELIITTFRLPKKRHLFLTGEKQVGKSTLLCRLTADKPLPGGFLTIRKAQDNGDFAVYMLHPQNDHCREENWLFTCGKPVDPQRFDDLGCRYLLESSSRSFLIMDELGPKENNAHAFQSAVLQALNADTPIYGVLQEADSAFLRQVAAHPKVQIVQVTKKNRNALYQELKKKW